MNGYIFDSSSFQGAKQAWANLLDELEQDRAAAERLAAVRAPGHEPASGFVAETQNTSGQALLDSITQMQAFAQSYLNNLEQNQHQYQAQETSTSQILQNRTR